MRRREFIAGLGSTAAWPRAARAQAGAARIAPNGRQQLAASKKTVVAGWKTFAR